MKPKHGLDETNEVRETRSALLSVTALEAIGLPERCFAKHISGGHIVVLLRGEMGYHDTDAYEVTGLTVRELNAKLGVTEAQEKAMLCGSIFGFHCPGADPRSYE